MKKRSKQLLQFVLCSILLCLSFIPPYHLPKAKAFDNTSYAIVNFRTKDCNTNTNFTMENGKSGYTNGCYGADAAFLGYENGKVKFKLSGVIGYVNPDEVELRNMDPEIPTTYMSSYKIENGVIKHTIQLDVNNYKSGNTIAIGKAPNGISNGTYYSYDGIYFYEANLNGFKMMIDDYRENTSRRAVNANNPFYNYYSYLPSRTISNYTINDIAVDFSGWSSKMTSYPAASHESQLYGEQQAFIEYQNQYGVNAMMILGLAKNESGMGKSSISYTKNNLFGIGAYDSNTGAAKAFGTVREGIRYYSKNLVSEGYMDPFDAVAGGRYHGGHFGNKGSGMNIKYASDPFWGEKEASYYFAFDQAYGMQDYNKYKIGIKSNTGNYAIKKDASTSSQTLYTTGTDRNIPFVILGQVSNSEGTWYKVQTDPTLHDGRGSVRQDAGAYDFNNNYGYIHSSIISYTSSGSNLKPRYTIDFNPNGGVFPDGETTTKRLTVEEYTVPNVLEPTRSGYRFNGWSETVSAAQQNKTYTANWKSLNPTKYNITFDANGGTFKDGSTTKVVVTEEGNKPVMSEQPSKTGYRFIKWDSSIANATGNKTYKAVYEKVKEKYNITFDANGGTFTGNKDTLVIETEEGSIPNPETPKKTGYIFTGWTPDLKVATGVTTYQATWKKGTIEETLIKKDGLFYFNYLKEENGKLNLQGYQTIPGIDNNLNTNITYEIVLENLDTSEKTTVKAERITKKEDIPKPVYSPDGKDYTYSWFNGTIDIDSLDSGNYKMYILAYTDTYYAKSIINNKTYNQQVTKVTGKSRAAIINNNYDTSTSFVELKVRDDLLAQKNGSYIYNQYDKYTTFEFTPEAKLHLRGNSYSYGMDLAPTKTVTRKIIFEHQETYKTYTKDLGTITNGNYQVFLPVSDNLDKTKAWYDKSIDISDIPVGKYTIYVTTSSNITDILELTEKIGRNLDSVTTTIGSKKYSFYINKARGNRIEMIVK